MVNRKEKNHREISSVEDSNRGTAKRNPGQQNKSATENFEAADTKAAEDNPRIKHASQVSGKSTEEGDEDYDDEQETTDD